MSSGTTRDRLSSAATRLFHQRGINRTTLAEIAEAAGVPLGNVYYHFRTKEALVYEVTNRHAEALRNAFAEYAATHADNPRAALQAYLRASRAQSETLARYGCPYGTLCQELEKDPGAAAEYAQSLLRLHLDWFAEQFGRLNPAEASALAEELLCRMQGAYMVASGLQSPAFLEQQIDRLFAWIEHIPAV